MTPSFRFRINNLVSSAWITSICIGLLLTIVFLWPVLQHFSTHLPSRDDGILISYLISWVSQALLAGQNPYQLPLFHPYPLTLTYSDPFLTMGGLSLPLTQLTRNLAILSNTWLILGTLSTFIGMYLLSWEFYRSRFASVLTAVVFTFSSLHFHYLVHLHTYVIPGLPLTWYFGLRWLKTEQHRFLIGAGVTFLLQALNAPMTGFFVGFSHLPWLIQPAVRHHLQRHWQVVGVVIGSVAVSLAATYLPYFYISAQFDYTRSIRDAAAFAHSLNFWWQPERVLLLGVGLLGWYRARRQTSTGSTSSFISPLTLILVAAMGGVLMLGPVLKVNDQTVKLGEWAIPLPYAVLYYVVPGFQAFRTSSRWVTLLNFGLALILGHYWSQVSGHRLTRWLILILLASWLWGTQVPQLPPFAIPVTRDPMYEVIKARPETVLAELPVFSWNMTPFNSVENDRLITQLYHGKKLYNGTSGFTPPERETAALWLWHHFPDQASIEYLRSQQVELILVNFAIYQAAENQGFTVSNQAAPPTSVIRRLLSLEPQLELVSCNQDACLYTIRK